MWPQTCLKTDLLDIEYYIGCCTIQTDIYFTKGHSGKVTHGLLSGVKMILDITVPNTITSNIYIYIYTVYLNVTLFVYDTYYPGLEGFDLYW